MNINDLMIKQGRFIFRWRSFIPFLLLFPAIAALEQGTFIQTRYGDKFEDIYVLLCYAFSLMGLAIRWFTVGSTFPGTSGRNTMNQRADRLNTTGMYSIVKNPLYLGNFIVLLGMLLSVQEWWFIFLGILLYWVYIERVIATEEKYLTEKFAGAYTDWAARTPIIIPRPSLWQKQETAFSVKKVLKNENYGIAVVGIFFFLNDFFSDVIKEREAFLPWLMDDWFWTTILIVSLGVFGLLRFFKEED